MARHIFQGIFTDGNGRIVSATTTADGNAGLISIYLAGTTTPANVYEAASGGAHVNSVYTDDDGKFVFYVDDSDYTQDQKFKIILSHANFQSQEYDDIEIVPNIDKTYYYYVDATASDQGAATADGDRSLYDLVTSIGTSKRATIIFAHSSASSTTTYTFLTSLNLDSYSNITIKIENGAILSPASGKTLTISHLEAGLYQVFDGDGTVAGGPKIAAAYPEWFGAIGDWNGSTGTDDNIALQKTIDFCNVVHLHQSYFSNSEIEIKNDNTHIKGFNGATLAGGNNITSSSMGILYVNSGSPSARIQGIKIEDIIFYGTTEIDGFSEHTHLVSFNGVKNCVIDNCKFIGFRGDGVYLGSGINAGDERHNENVIIQNCLFDGANNANRNGISIIDGYNITIANNTYRNCSSSTMPGPIDFEPNSTFSIIKNIKVGNNIFESTCGGNIGCISIVLGQAFTTQPQDFNINENIFSNPDNNGITIVQSSSSYTDPFYINIYGNTGKISKRPINISKYLNKVAISDNVLEGGLSLIITYDTDNFIQDLVLTGNTFTVVGQSSVLHINGCEDALFNGNNFIGSDYSINLLGNVASSNIIVTNNVFKANISSIINSGTVDGSTCVYKNNLGAASNWVAWLTDENNKVQTFDSTTYPQDFPGGISRTVINGDTGVPSTGGYQGILETHRISLLSGYTKWIYQLYYPANNSLNLGSIFIRHWATDTTWTGWYELAGTAV